MRRSMNSATIPSPQVAGAQRRARLLGNEVWLTESQVDELLLRPGRRRTTAQLREARRLTGVAIGGVYLYPHVQFDLTAREVRPVMAKILAVIPCDMGEWATINWLFQGRRSLDGKRPADILSSAPTLAIKAALDDFMPSNADW